MAATRTRHRCQRDVLAFDADVVQPSAETRVDVRADIEHELTSGVLRPFIRTLRVDLARYTVRNIVNTLTTLFDDAMAEELVSLESNPMRHPGVRKEIPEGIPCAGRGVIVHFPREVAGKLVTCPAVPFHRRVRYLVVVTGGQRNGEAAALLVSDLDLDAAIPTVDISKALAEKALHGRSAIRPPKTRDGIRKLPLHQLAIPVLRAWLDDGWKQYVGRAPLPTDPVFPSRRGHLVHFAGARAIRRDLKAAGCATEYQGHPIDFHATRRPFATWLATAGVQEATIKRLLGHAGGNVTQRH